jgi:hypothetical protein
MIPEQHCPHGQFDVLWILSKMMIPDQTARTGSSVY